jgi:hypothetical protein
MPARAWQLCSLKANNPLQVDLMMRHLDGDAATELEHLQTDAAC